MEQLLHYCWKHRLYPIARLRTTGGDEVEVIDPGLHNQNAGPDFFNAKVRRITTTPTPPTIMWCCTWWERPTRKP